MKPFSFWCKKVNHNLHVLARGIYIAYFSSGVSQVLRILDSMCGYPICLKSSIVPLHNKAAAQCVF